MTESVIDIVELRKTYGELVAVDGVSFDVRKDKSGSVSVGPYSR
jgi:ABC-type branched-subunit amino acid transport system ATPase component